MDKVLIEGLRVNAVIGVFEWERQIEQPVLIDLVMTVDTRAAAISDDIQDAVNYALVAEQVADLTKSLKPQLLGCSSEGEEATCSQRCAGGRY
jgi:dihydroneopterin aldolase